MGTQDHFSLIIIFTQGKLALFYLHMPYTIHNSGTNQECGSFCVVLATFVENLFAGVLEGAAWGQDKERLHSKGALLPVWPDIFCVLGECVGGG